MNALTPMTTPAAEQFCATIMGRDGQHLLVERDGSAQTVRRALSCLVQPEPGDLVLLGGPATRPFVLAVLDRSGAAPLRIAVEGNIEIAADGGRLTLTGDAMVMAARTGHVLVDDLALTGEKVTSRFGRISVVAEAIESLVTRLLTRAKRSYRFVEETEQLRAQNIDQRASGHLHLRGQTAVLHAGVVVKLDAAQIHMG
ncbi:DUF3540 domain-containing protein [Plastoroseomonas arctica]|uniref:DUF3540 domain-containing protein n=1 Tax=Plastoroseomonas arctica TaxID=1509237 RepID=A0AAF1KL58_9PROT|nr:DUF3540 domain-containing protein [Plastoroseomonas arctica]MBR0654356.1 DUF3540 domain-containing protein [Plastoroseomonas arctica]